TRKGASRLVVDVGAEETYEEARAREARGDGMEEVQSSQVDYFGDGDEESAQREPVEDEDEGAPPTDAEELPTSMLATEIPVEVEVQAPGFPKRKRPSKAELAERATSASYPATDIPLPREMTDAAPAIVKLGDQEMPLIDPSFSHEERPAPPPRVEAS